MIKKYSLVLVTFTFLFSLFLVLILSSCSSTKYRTRQFSNREVYYQKHRETRGNFQPIRHNIKVRYSPPPKPREKPAYRRKR